MGSEQVLNAVNSSALFVIAKNWKQQSVKGKRINRIAVYALSGCCKPYSDSFSQKTANLMVIFLKASKWWSHYINIHRSEL